VHLCTHGMRACGTGTHAGFGYGICVIVESSLHLGLG
jgi:hypothetical protein